MRLSTYVSAAIQKLWPAEVGKRGQRERRGNRTDCHTAITHMDIRGNRDAKRRKT
jgi:hypothetical protein